MDGLGRGDVRVLLSRCVVGQAVEGPSLGDESDDHRSRRACLRWPTMREPQRPLNVDQFLFRAGGRREQANFT